MGSPDRIIRRHGVKGAIAALILLAAADRYDVIGIGNSDQPIAVTNQQAPEVLNRSHEIEVISANLSYALRWLTLQGNPNLDSAIMDISRIQGKITREGDTQHISDLDPSAVDSQYAGVLPAGYGESLIIALSAEKFSDPAFNRAEAARDLLVAWRVRERSKNEPERFINDPAFRSKVELLARGFVDGQLASR